MTARDSSHSSGPGAIDPREATAAGPGSKPRPGLYLVATPIGNLGDISPRALDVLRAADLIACEDTRHTGSLLARFGIKAALQAYYDHNAAKVRPLLLRRLAGGALVALVSDAGTPLISDPGYKLVRDALAQGSFVTAVPGPSALLAALCIAGLPTDRFYFGGFLPAKAGARRQALQDAARVPATLVFFDSPQRLAESLADMAVVLGARDAAVARELTKLHEEVRRGPLPELAAAYAAEPAPRGEIVIVVGPAPEEAAAAVDIDAALRRALVTMSVREAAAAVAAATGAPKREVYRRALALEAARDG